MDKEALESRVREILDGIDRGESDGGWWETSFGEQFGAEKLRLVVEAIHTS